MQKEEQCHEERRCFPIVVLTHTQLDTDAAILVYTDCLPDQILLLYSCGYVCTATYQSILDWRQ